MKKRIISLMICLAMLTGTLTACGSGTKPDNSVPSSKPEDVASTKPEDVPKPVELTLWVGSRGSDDFGAKAKEEFMKLNPHITFNEVVKEGDPGNEFYQGVAAGTAPDVISVSFTMMDKYMKAGIIEPLNEYQSKWAEWPEFTKEYVDMFTRDGKSYGVPYSVAPMLFGYNKALLKAAGYDAPPKTWEEAIEIAKKVNNPEKQVIGYATLAAEWTEWFFQYYVWQAGGDLTKQNPDDTATLTFTDPAVIEAAKFYQKLSSSSVMQSDRTMKFGDLTAAFGQGRIGMMPFAGDWVTDAIKQGINPDDIGLCLPPAGPSGETATAIAGSCYVINAKASQEKKDAAWKYIEFYAGKKFMSDDMENKASQGANNPIIVPRSDLAASDFYDFPAEYQAVLDQVKTVGRLEFYGKSDFGAYVDKAVQKVLSDPNANPETEFKAAQDLAEKEALSQFNKSAKGE